MQDWLARRVYEYCGLPATRPASVVQLARRLFGRENVRLVDRGELGVGGSRHVCVWSTGSEFVLLIAQDTPPVVLQTEGAREIAKWLLFHLNIPTAGDQVVAPLARALIAPRDALRHYVEKYGEDITRLCTRFTMRQADLLARLEELRTAPVAPITPSQRMRATRAFPLPDENGNK